MRRDYRMFRKSKTVYLLFNDMHLKWEIPKKGKLFSKLLHVHIIAWNRNIEADEGRHW